MNQLTLIGNLTRDPETRHAASGTQVTTANIAWNSRRKKDKKPLYVKCVAFGKLAEIVDQYCRKGDKVLFQGELEIEEWETKDGQARTTPTMTIEKVELLGGKRDHDHGGEPAREERQASRREEREPREEQHENAEDDLPF